MLDRIKQIGKRLLAYLVYIAIYGFVLYCIFTWLASYSLLFAYFGNLALIIIAITLDELMLKRIQSEKFVIYVKKLKDPEKSYRSVRRNLDTSVSLKTDLYVFYILVLIASQIIVFYPALVSEEIGNFIQANNYSILFLIAFDALARQFSKDRERIKKITEEFEKEFNENQD